MFRGVFREKKETDALFNLYWKLLIFFKISGYKSKLLTRC